MANFPSPVLLQIQAGTQYLSNLVQQQISERKQGCGDCSPNGLECLQRTINALNYKVELDQYDSIAIKNVDIMLKIIGDYQLVVPALAYWGFKSTNTVLTYAQIIAGNQVSFPVGQTYIDIPFNVPTLSYLWFSFPQTEITKTVYQDLVDPDNYGTIGTPDDLIGAPTIVSGAVPQKFQISNYLTIQLNTLRFKNS